MIRTVADTNVYVSVREALAEVTTLASLVHPSLAIRGITTHHQDHRILECAVTAGADLLVTADERHLQKLRILEGVRILSPRAFLNTLVDHP